MSILKGSTLLDLSFEFFPPKTEDHEPKMWEAIDKLALLKPLFMSVTYGAGGTSRGNTNRIAKEVEKRTKIRAAAHLTCIRAPKSEIDEIARTHWETGVKHIVALRGDPPRDHSELPADRYKFASELIKGLQAIGDFEISVAAFPEKHPESPSFEQDIEILKLKESLGVKRAITQYFFDDVHYLRLRDRAIKAGITIPIVPGIIPINHYAHIKKFSDMCGTSMPADVAKIFEPLDNNPEARDKAAIDLATKQCALLIKEGIPALHFYTMNRFDLITAVYNNLGGL